MVFSRFIAVTLAHGSVPPNSYWVWLVALIWFHYLQRIISQLLPHFLPFQRRLPCVLEMSLQTGPKYSHQNEPQHRWLRKVAWTCNASRLWLSGTRGSLGSVTSTQSLMWAGYRTTLLLQVCLCPPCRSHGRGALLERQRTRQPAPCSVFCAHPSQWPWTNAWPPRYTKCLLTPAPSSCPLLL